MQIIEGTNNVSSLLNCMIVETGEVEVITFKTDSEKGRSFARSIWLAFSDGYNYGIT